MDCAPIANPKPRRGPKGRRQLYWFNDATGQIESGSRRPRLRGDPDLASYDVIAVSTSGGKDSQAMMARMAQLTQAAGVSERVVAVHCDLGEAEWEGAAALARQHADHYGWPLRVVTRAQGDLLYEVEFQRKKWPDYSNRYCTGDQKTKQVVNVISAMLADVKDSLSSRGLTRPPRVLNVLGIRADESPRRKKMASYEWDSASSSRRTIHRWLPIHEWSVEEVWETIASEGTPYHEAYDLGMSRFSCSFCIMANIHDLRIAAKARPKLLAEYVRIERKIQHTFKADLALEALQVEMQGGPRVQAQVGERGRVPVRRQYVAIERLFGRRPQNTFEDEADLEFVAAAESIGVPEAQITLDESPVVLRWKGYQKGYRAAAPAGGNYIVARGRKHWTAYYEGANGERRRLGKATTFKMAKRYCAATWAGGNSCAVR
jgi:3'-phosphoadenosine 5'-phosphosulfate sulfotransferase (PAPS reductase)/FAD synthetase